MISFIKHAGAALALMLSLSAQASTLSVDVGGTQSKGEFGNAANTVLSLNLGAGAALSRFSWDVELEAFAPSQLSNLRLAISGTDLDLGGLLFTPGEGVDAAGSMHFTGSLDLAAEGLSFLLGSDGLLRLEFHQAASNGLNPDGLWKSGTLSFDTDAVTVPEPGSLLLIASGLSLLAIAQRRRKQINSDKT